MCFRDIVYRVFFYCQLVVLALYVQVSQAGPLDPARETLAKLFGEDYTCTHESFLNSERNSLRSNLCARLLLREAIIYDQIDDLKLMIDQGAEFDMEDWLGQVPLHWAADECSPGAVSVPVLINLSMFGSVLCSLNNS